jgi:CRISPR-associated endonuclease/helicase Cas3
MRRSLSAMGIETILHHSRYALQDRTILDRRLMEIMGPKASKRRGLVVVATQTAEQSLDIDADLLITDACPADVLLQRLGRLHRHQRDGRPVGYVEPGALLIEPGDLGTYIGDSGAVYGRPGQGWPWIYPNLLAVGATLDWVRKQGVVSVPQDSRQLVEQATHADLLRETAAARGGRWLALWSKLHGRDTAHRQQARSISADWNLPYADSLVDPDAATRLGDGSIDLEVTGDLRSPSTDRRSRCCPCRHGGSSGRRYRSARRRDLPAAR